MAGVDSGPKPRPRTRIGGPSIKALALACVLEGCSRHVPSQPTPSTSAVESHPREAASASTAAMPQIPVPPGRADEPRACSKVRVSHVPCSWFAHNAFAIQPEIAWQIDARGESRVLDVLQYGMAPDGYTSTIGPKLLEDGCHCVHVDECCSRFGEFELRDGVVTSPCTRWGASARPLPAGDFVAYEIEGKVRSRTAWKVDATGGIAVHVPSSPVELDGPLRRRLRVRSSPIEGSKTALAGPDETDGGWIEPFDLIVDEGSPVLRGRWIGDRFQLQAIYLVRRGEPHGVVLLEVGSAVVANPEEILAHGLVDLDSDGLEDLVLVWIPLDSAPDRRIVVDALLSQGGPGLFERSLDWAWPAEHGGMPHDPWQYPWASDAWQVEAVNGGVEVRVTTVTGRTHAWGFSLQGDALRQTYRGPGKWGTLPNTRSR
jgi:hypothetical protein